MKIRSACFDDAARIAELCTELGYPSTAAETRRRMELIRSRPEQLLIVVAEGIRVLGFVHLEERYLIERDPVLQVAAIVVGQESRGKGVGKCLMHFAESFAKARSLDIMLRSGSQREDAHKFYESIGYQNCGMSVKFEKPV